MKNRMQTVVLTISYDPEREDDPCDWPFTDMLDLRTDQAIVSATWWHDGKDHVPAIEKLKTEGKL